MAALSSSKMQLAIKPQLPLRSSRQQVVKPVASGGEKIDIRTKGLNSIENDVVQQNLMGRSRYMKKKDWRDAQGRKGKGYGVYRFEDKYGANVDGYSPIYTPDQWTSDGQIYKLGTKGLIAWAGLILVLLAVGVNLVVSTSQLSS
mmetsp:Transcript_22594/g.62416  ORF Transcript_22594/g.62416 Transcript_22594/m.62416 type:complete len:145 (-) Transcript_22594:397-831(-)|eukprot:CAMPEP_0202337360 /NCGR_PEP_ID=MMETSP1126-20121109/65_1 /ASSEMBLY_ACC=CAM_ASM_000457 /TAXON_ID=3047 /ORGANISM="Dunaliella tertiolecta, Strain CCMP1320" /LENGTH=144 /DNA_ID=CAMNT_0048927519 /DNA_START=88 /DNA_END=522 /DNA_ORIENTATION=+